MQNGRASKGPSLNFYLTVSLVGAMRGGLCLFLEHPLESIKTQWQDKTNFRTSREIVKDIYASKGLLGFYRGFVPNFIRVTSKHFYRWPLMLFFPNFYQRNIPKKYSNRFSGLNKILTGLTIANIEIFIHCPLDRIKIYFMTSNFQGYINGSSKIAYFYKTYRNNLLYELARGFGPTFWRSNVSWVSFLYLDHKVKQVFKSLRKTEVLSFMDLLLVSIFVGTGNLMMSKYKWYYYNFL